MFSLNENNRIVMARYPCDMRMGVDAMCGRVRAVGLDPAGGDVYVFVGKSRKVMKILHWECGGYTMYYKRLERGRFHPRIFLRQGVGNGAQEHLFSKNDRGAEDYAVFYSLLESCDIIGINPL